MCCYSFNNLCNLEKVQNQPQTKRGTRGGQIRPIITIVSKSRPPTSLQKVNQSGCNQNNLTKIQIKDESRLEFPVLYFANARSLLNKIDKLSCELNNYKVHIAIISETWLNEPIPDQLLEIEGYQILRKDRINQRGGGVCIYLKHNLKLIRWDKLENSDKETIWITIRPNKLPRDVTNITIVGVYHPRNPTMSK